MKLRTGDKWPPDQRWTERPRWPDKCWSKQVENSKDRVINTAVLTENDEKTIEKKEVNKKILKELVDKIKNTDISKKTEKSVKELNLVLSRAEKALDNKEVTQEEIDKEVKTLKEIFDN